MSGLGRFLAECRNLPLYCKGWTSSTATFIPRSASSFTMAAPIPSLPPVITTTSRLQSYFSSVVELFRTRRFNRAVMRWIRPKMSAKRSRRRNVGRAAAFSRPRCVYRDSRSNGRVRYGLRMVRLISRPIVSAVMPETLRRVNQLAAILLSLCYAA